MNTFLRTRAAFVVVLVLFSADIPATEYFARDDSLFGRFIAADTVVFESAPCMFMHEGRLVVHIIGDSATDVVRVFDAATMEEKWHAKGGPLVYPPFQNGNSGIIIYNPINETASNVRAYDIDGILLFQKDYFKGGLYSFPGAKFYYTAWDPISLGHLQVLDSSGHEIYTNNELRGDWYTYAVNDSLLAFIRESEIVFFSFPGRKTVKQMTIPPSQRGDYPVVRVSRSDDAMFMQWYEYLIHIGPGLVIDWSLPESGTLHDAVFSENNSLIAAIVDERPNPTLRIYRSSDGKLLSSTEIDGQFVGSIYRFSDMWFLDDKIGVKSPYISYNNKAPCTQAVTTHVFRIDPESGSVVGRKRYDFNLFLMALPDGYRTFIHSADQPDAVVIYDWR